MARTQGAPRRGEVMKPAWIWLIVAVAPLGTAFAQSAPEAVDQRIQERIQACMQLPITERNGCLDKLSQRVRACTKLPITEQFGCLGKLSGDTATGPLSNPEARASTIPDPAQLKQAPQQDEKAEKPMPELMAELAQLKQQLQEERGKNEKLAGEVKAELAQLKQAPQDREKTEKPMRELMAELAQVKQQLQEERGKNKKLAGEDKAELDQVEPA